MSEDADPSSMAGDGLPLSGGADDTWDGGGVVLEDGRGGDQVNGVDTLETRAMSNQMDRRGGEGLGDRCPGSTRDAARSRDPGPVHEGKWNGRLRSQKKHKRMLSPRTANFQQGEM